MRYRLFMIVAILMGLMLLSPSKAFAIDFTISGSTIDAYLSPNGDVEVVESHIYDFDDDFNGLTRTLYPKQGTNIVDVQATENGQELEVEQEGDLYKIHRTGSYETVELELTYIIKDGVDVYSDVADFYWPFFDSSNETPYKNMNISIHPPEETSDVIAFGYDHSFGKERIEPNGMVIFNLNEVPDGKNGDIRVAYPAELFPAASGSIESMRDEILTQEQEGIDGAAAYISRQGTLSTLASIFIPVAGLILLLLITSSYLKASRMYKSFKNKDVKTIPKQSLSMLGTISFIRSHALPSEALAAGLLDLIRQGYVKEDGTNHFTLLHHDRASQQELILIEWLFTKIGDGQSFTLQQLEKYAKDKKNHETYQLYDQNWKKAIRQEVKEAQLFENKAAHRITVGLSSLLLMPFIILFPIHELFMWFTITLILFIGYIGYACFYHPRTEKGAKIGHEWYQYKRNVNSKPLKEMMTWPSDDLMRAVIYGLGTNDKKLQDKSNSIADVFKKQASSSANAYSFDMTSFIALSSVASSTVRSANSSATPASTSSGGSPGGGTGGGGGGSGAF
ncbi:DUF2207 domain-containing protein [Alkalicoccobacillus porphyridii]|uniref:DUF2207 domain-containing protein n=1 Tax=Alkalicoccobacillus porphyridii TaxID=2597270 RepID=A0A554A1R4_9BACI|nr:DUF2207 domain-containing protein [Alkalicoccobacillus porphyridii]TSB47596.1 DUF2207 domain-containing protein [Alkalicoccobacillus porphyridii]